MTDSVRDTAYFEIVARRPYKPKFGTSGAEGSTRQQFKLRYGEDPFYRWVEINFPLMYAEGRDDAPGGLVVAVGDGQDARLRAKTRA